MEFDLKWEEKMARKLKKEHKERILRRFKETFDRYFKEKDHFDAMKQFKPVEKYRDGHEIAKSEDLCYIFNMFVDEINRLKKRLADLEPNWEQYQNDSQADSYDYHDEEMEKYYDPH